MTSLIKPCEQHFINKFDSYRNGYNMTPGGDKNPMKTESVRLKLAETCSTDEHKAARATRRANDPREQARIAKIKATYARKKAERTASQ